MFIDKNKILCIEENLDIVYENKKKYGHILSGYSVESFDKSIFVWHKKEIREVQRKDLGKNMSVFWIEKRIEDNKYGVLDPQSIVAGLAFFQSYDEERAEKYCFLPKYSLEKMNELKQKLKDISIDVNLENTDKGVVFYGYEELVEIQILGFLFGLSLTYGKREVKEGDLKSVKIQISLFGQYLKKQEGLDFKILHLQEDGLFLTKTIQTTNDGVVYEIVVSDYEVLQIWDNLYQKIENVEKISKYEHMLEAKTKLMLYIKEHGLANEQELEDLDDARIKLLVK